jgi:hypothetical protein
VSTEIARLSGDVSALAGHTGALYVAVENDVHAIDLGSYATRHVATLSRAVRGLASDGASLYTLHGGGIGQLDVRTGGWSQIAGKPQLGAGNRLVLSIDEPPPDGVVEHAVIDAAQRISYDTGGLWFSDCARLRRLALAERYVTTLALA